VFPLYYERYIEVFGGGGWVLFHKNPGNDFEVYNDFNSLLTNLYRCVREQPRELMEALRYVLNSREDFELVRSALSATARRATYRKRRGFISSSATAMPRAHQLRQPAPRYPRQFPLIDSPPAIGKGGD
jgi:site-specific DNA-adenine methylase